MQQQIHFEGNTKTFFFSIKILSKRHDVYPLLTFKQNHNSSLTKESLRYQSPALCTSTIHPDHLPVSRVNVAFPSLE